MAVPNWSAFVNLLARAAIKLFPAAECVPNWSAFDDVGESFSSCERDTLSGMLVPEAICIGTRKQEGENKLQLSKLQLNKMEGTESGPDWSGLFSELLGEIAIKLICFEDFTAFRGVCTSWRAATTTAKFLQVPLLMLAEKDGDGDVREFYSVCKSKICTRMLMPEAKGKKCIGVGFGWILTVAASGEELKLVKPLSSAKIKLPNYKYGAEPFFMKQAVLSANPTETSDFLLIVGVYWNLGFWRNGDNHWTNIEPKITIRGQQRRSCFADIGYYKHKMYGIDFTGNVWRWDPYLMKEAEILLQLHVLLVQLMDQASLVESSKGDLLLITRNSLHRSGELMYKPRFGIFQIDAVRREYRKMKNLDGDAIFIGQNRGVSIAANDFPGVVKANCIYFTDTDWEQHMYTADGGGADMGIYSVEDKSIERFGVESFSFICPPLWVCPSL